LAGYISLTKETGDLEGVLRDTTFTVTGASRRLLAVKVPLAVTARPSGVNVGWKEVTALGK
jgi:hypothetical protein